MQAGVDPLWEEKEGGENGIMQENRKSSKHELSRDYTNDDIKSD